MYSLPPTTSSSSVSRSLRRRVFEAREMEIRSSSLSYQTGCDLEEVWVCSVRSRSFVTEAGSWVAPLSRKKSWNDVNERRRDAKYDLRLHLLYHLSLRLLRSPFLHCSHVWLVTFPPQPGFSSETRGSPHCHRTVPSPGVARRRPLAAHR